MQRQQWEQDGVLVLPGFYDDAAVKELQAIHRQVWRSLPLHVTVDDMETHRRTVPRLLTTKDLRRRYKVNDLYLSEPRVREHVMDPRMVEILSELLHDTPALCNTLSLDYGTAQPAHVDSLYMTPHTPGNLVATWIALEDVDREAGPLSYYPGSHKIPPYRFSNGGYHAVASEMSAWKTYTDDWVRRLGLKEIQFLPKKGDVLIWHAQLLHGGSPVKNPGRTRRSLVSHFYTSMDARARDARLEALNNGLWINRDPQPLSTEEVRNLQKSLRPRRRAALWMRRLILSAEQTSLQSGHLVAMPVARALRLAASLRHLQP